MATMRPYVLLFAAVLLSFAAHSHARQLTQATCTAVLAQGLAAKAASATFKSGLAADCPLATAPTDPCHINCICFWAEQYLEEVVSSAVTLKATPAQFANAVEGCADTNAITIAIPAGIVNVRQTNPACQTIFKKLVAGVAAEDESAIDAICP